MSDKTKLQKHINAKHKQLLDHPQCVMVCTILRLRGLGIASFHIVTECIQIPFSFNVLCQLSVWILFFSGRKNILKKKSLIALGLIGGKKFTWKCYVDPQYLCTKRKNYVWQQALRSDEATLHCLPPVIPIALHLTFFVLCM